MMRSAGCGLLAMVAVVTTAGTARAQQAIETEAPRGGTLHVGPVGEPYRIEVSRAEAPARVEGAQSCRAPCTLALTPGWWRLTSRWADGVTGQETARVDRDEEFHRSHSRTPTTVSPHTQRALHRRAVQSSYAAAVLTVFGAAASITGTAVVLQPGPVGFGTTLGGGVLCAAGPIFVAAGALLYGIAAGDERQSGSGDRSVPAGVLWRPTMGALSNGVSAGVSGAF